MAEQIQKQRRHYRSTEKYNQEQPVEIKAENTGSLAVQHEAELCLADIDAVLEYNDAA